MDKTYHTVDAYRDFRQLIDQADQWLVNVTMPLFGRSADIVKHRLTQRLVEYAFIPFVGVLKQRIDDGMMPLGNSRVCLNAIVIDTQDGAVKLTTGGYLQQAMEFFAHWGLTLGAILQGMGLQRTRGPATLVYGIGSESLFVAGTDTRFVGYCQQCAIQPLRDARQLLIQSTLHQGSLSNPKYVYVKYPHLALVKTAKLGWLRRLNLFISHLASPFGFALAAVRDPLFILLGRDFALAEVMSTLDEAGQIEAVILTNSTGKSQPLWMRGKRNFPVHMVWYSQNTKPHIYREHPVQAQIPHIRHIAADIHWVWTAGYKNYLEETLDYPGKIEIVGPILWYLPEKVAHPDNHFNLAVFDVMPLKDSITTQFGMLDNFFNASNMMLFLQELVKVCDEVNEESGVTINVLLKHKRDVAHPAWATEYLELVSDFAAKNKLKLIDHQTNIFSMISGCLLTVAIPYSSPVYASSYIGVPAIYFDPTEQLLPTYEKLDEIYFASGRVQLAKMITEIINKS